MLVATLRKERQLTLTCYGQLVGLSLTLSYKRHRSRCGSDLRNYVVGRSLSYNYIVVLATTDCHCVALNRDIGIGRKCRLDRVVGIVEATHIGSTLNRNIVVVTAD